MKKIDYPYLPEGREIKYVPEDNEFMSEAKNIALQYKGALMQPGGVVVVKDKRIIGRGSVGMNYHSKHGCERIKLNFPTGVGYDKCPGCSPENHSEANAIKDAIKNGFDAKGADLYLWGHWWFCKDCWDKMIGAGIKNTFLLKNSEILFNKSHPGNIIQ
ncbi:MAG TPA: deaminase [Candidatus Dojkabacteria bacterium]|jgi:deoxycytidylate deaminase